MVHSDLMVPKLRQLVEQQLLADLRCYGIERTDIKFDWSFTTFQDLDDCSSKAEIESLMGVYVYDAADEDDNDCIAAGEVKVLRAGEFIFAYWDFLDGYSLCGYEGPSFKTLKSTPGIPAHVWQQIPVELQPLFVRNRM